ncbi:MAG: succinate dehydrogenase assembly factor 2 [Steroidobacteraceae bacterium]
MHSNIRRARLVFRSWNRGTQESDLLLGAFAVGCLPSLSEEQLPLMLVTALSPVIGYDKASAIAHKAHNEDLSLKEAAIRSGYVDEKQFDEIVDPRKMVGRPVPAN